MAEKKDKEKKVKVVVREGTVVLLNGKKIEVKPGTQELPESLAQILVNSGYAEEVS